MTVEVAESSAPAQQQKAGELGRPGPPQEFQATRKNVAAKARAQNKMRQFAEKEMRADGRKVSQHFLAAQRKKESRCAIL